ncbi:MULTISPECIES: cytochrome P460 family protein [unclassified Paenibacillus]|uniref:cytochrome P460 family protein n=1 Tax=unclassified Paenibacillus TaxID=185978 RepID=UPI0027814B6D|nr:MULTISPECIES: cytochrome P460 family protein [unclassified Paenibacillus]MDQ0899185.1 hypothetical protein [Paenibacillus sp. V4I7]MDQ0914825.1 hypothetical protein [Paenibacillus sp. V4I5]
MKRIFWLVLGLVPILVVTSCGSKNNDMMSMTGQLEAKVENYQKNYDNPVKFPGNYEDGILYSTIKRGNITEPLYTSREAIEAAKNGEPFPDGTVLTLVIYKDGKLDETLVAEKRNDWNDEPSGEKNGDWRYQAFNPDRSVNEQRSIPSCISCHAGQEVNDFT